MLIEEAKWLARQIAELEPDRVFPLLDVGSSTQRFRAIEQPWIDREIFGPARQAGHAVSHLDAKPAPGVDIVADLGDARAIEGLVRRGYRSVFCSNLLEHVEDREKIARALVGLVPPGGYLFVSCPYRYPFHPDPIDSMFRPDPQQLAELFEGTRIYREAVIQNGNYFRELQRTPLATLRLLLRLLLPFYKPEAWRRAQQEFRRYLPWMFRRFAATCVVLQREAPTLPSPASGGGK
jgi:SAM-dependent methyltransferase